MRENAGRFEGLAETYDAYRPDYPDEVFQTLFESVPRDVPCAIDVGAGTGISTAALRRTLPPDWLVIAIEPGADMRRVLTRRFKSVPHVQPLDATAEAMAVPNSSVSLIVACTAYHWFDTQAFYAEAARVLVPEGVVALIRNRRSPDAFVKRIDGFLGAHLVDVVDMEKRERRKEPSVRDLSAVPWLKATRSKKVLWQQTVTRRSLIDLYLTRSTTTQVVRALGLPAVVSAFEEIWAEEVAGETHVLNWETTLKWAKRA